MRHYMPLIYKMKHRGERHDFTGCLIPTEFKHLYNTPQNLFHKASDYFYDKYHATHYNCFVNKKGNITIELGRADGFGAASVTEVVHTIELPFGLLKLSNNMVL